MYSLPPKTKMISKFLWGILEGRPDRAWPSQPIVKNCQNTCRWNLNFFWPNDFIWSAMKVPFWQFFRMGWDGRALLGRPSRIPHRNFFLCLGCRWIWMAKLQSTYSFVLKYGKITVCRSFAKFSIKVAWSLQLLGYLGTKIGPFVYFQDFIVILAPLPSIEFAIFGI